MEKASDAISTYFGSVGGDNINDSDFIHYLNEETTLTGKVEILRPSHHELLKTQGLLTPPAPPEETVTQSSLIEVLKVLAQSQTSAAETQAKA